MKRCPKCTQWLSLENFAKRGGGLGANSYCRPCQNVYRRNIELLGAFLRSHACVDCGERDMRVLEFDHVRGVKVASVADMTGRGISWQRIEREIAKCEIRCANCHRRKTVAERGWWRNAGA